MIVHTRQTKNNILICVLFICICFYHCWAATSRTLCSVIAHRDDGIVEKYRPNFCSFVYLFILCMSECYFRIFVLVNLFILYSLVIICLYADIFVAKFSNVNEFKITVDFYAMAKKICAASIARTDFVCGTDRRVWVVLCSNREICLTKQIEKIERKN